VGPGAEIGEQVFIGAKVHLAHDVVVEPYVRILSGSNVAGHTRVGYGATIGMGATVIEELEIGAEASVGAGAVVIEDVPARAVVAGVPARILKMV
jgi:acetyltransferase-like isoleucine patch superfamily enzyme